MLPGVHRDEHRFAASFTRAAGLALDGLIATVCARDSTTRPGSGRDQNGSRRLGQPGRSLRAPLAKQTLFLPSACVYTIRRADPSLTA
jgi:hypothetical protein